MENKELTHQQARYLDILSEFNFQIIFRTGKTNGKMDALTQIPGSSEDKNLVYQTILTPDCVEVRVGEVEESLFECVHAANKTDELCSKYHSAIAKNAIKLHGTCLHECQIVDGALFKNNLLWVPDSLYTELL